MMSLFDRPNEELSAEYIKSATLVYMQPSFKAEVEKAVNECMAGCMDAIKAKDYQRAEVMNDVAEGIRLFHQRFAEMADQHAQSLENNSSSQSDEEE